MELAQSSRCASMVKPAIGRGDFTGPTRWTYVATRVSAGSSVLSLQTKRYAAPAQHARRKREGEEGRGRKGEDQGVSQATALSQRSYYIFCITVSAG